MKLSIVATLYASESSLREFHRRCSSAAKKIAGEDFELILVNDGSPDNSLDLALELSRSDDHLVVVDLSRNFGHHKAMMTGLSFARGDLVFLIDSDLEEDPNWVHSFRKLMFEQDADVVFGVQEERKGGLVERISGVWFYWLFHVLTRLELPANIVTARLMSQRYVQSLLLHKEREVFLAGLWHITGFKQLSAPVRKLSQSRSTYTLGRKMALLVNSVTSFSNAPLTAIFYFGLVLSTLAMTYILYLMNHWWMNSATPSGWTSFMASIWLLGGLIISFIGVIGIYLSKIFSEAKQRPYTIVRQVYGINDHKNPKSGSAVLFEQALGLREYAQGSGLEQ